MQTLLRADVIFGVGPKLAHAVAGLVRPATGMARVTELVPGLADVQALSTPPAAFTAITFGRLDPISDRLKQGTLAVGAFGQLVGEASDVVGRDPQLPSLSTWGEASGPS